jgi:tRNA(adenine34) deaminase
VRVETEPAALWQHENENRRDVAPSTDSRPAQADVAARSLSEDLAFEVAFAMAEQVSRSGNVPVGAALEVGGRIIAQAGNLRETLQDPCAHAELIALREGARKLGRWRLDDATLYVTLEPCAMCAGAIVQARVSKVVYAAAEPKTGAHESRYRLFDGSHTRVERRNDLSARAVNLLGAFFEALRERL